MKRVFCILILILGRKSYTPSATPEILDCTYNPKILW